MAEDMTHNAFPNTPETYEPQRRNPPYLRWDDPFTFVPQEYIIGLGQGFLLGKGKEDDDANHVRIGSDIILQRHIDSWNAGVDKGAVLPRITMALGMEWIPVMVGKGAKEENVRRKWRFEKRKRKEAAERKKLMKAERERAGK